MISKRWLVGLVALAAVLGVLVGAQIGWRGGQMAQGMPNRGMAMSQYTPAAVPSAPTGQEGAAVAPSYGMHGPHSGMGANMSHSQMGGRGGWMASGGMMMGFGRGLLGVLGGLLQLAIVVAAVAWLLPKAQAWWSQRADAIPASKQDPSVTDDMTG